MERIGTRLKNKAGLFFRSETSVSEWALAFLGVIGIRMALEVLILPNKNDSVEGILTAYLHYSLFFSILIMLVWLIAAFFAGIEIKKPAFLMLVLSWFIILPPILDMIKTGGRIYWSFYLLEDITSLFGQFKTFMGDLPPGIVYFGSKILFGSTVIFSGMAVFLKTKKLLRSLACSFFVYAALFFLASFPSWFSYAYYFLNENRPIWEVKTHHILHLFAVPVGILGLEEVVLKHAFAFKLNLIYFPMMIFLVGAIFFFSNRKKLFSVWNDFRFPQLIYHGGLFFVGMGLGFLAYPEAFKLEIFSFFAIFNLLLSIGLAWIASVFINDIYDFNVDKLSNPKRPLQQSIFTISEYKDLGFFFFILSLIGGLMIGIKFMLILVFYQFIAWTYSAPPFRIKKIPLIASFFSALASILILFLGFLLFSGDQNLAGMPWKAVLLLLVALTLSLPLKDFKDIEGDKKYGVWTIPVIFGEEKGRLVVAVGIFISFMLSVFLLNEFKLFWWAILFGIISFLVLINQKINPRNLFWWVLVPVSVYGAIMVKILFLN